MILAFDTETSGLRKEGLPDTDTSQPRLVQLGAKLFDAQWKKVGSMVVLIRPDGWAIEPEALAVHGIPTMRCQKYGVRLDSALLAFRDLVEDAARIVAHHAEFDRHVIAAAIHHAGGNGHWWARKAQHLFCTMEASAKTCDLPGQFGDAKFPKLEEAVAALLPGQAFPVKHDAESDIDATVAIYRELLRRGITKDPDPFAMAA